MVGLLAEGKQTAVRDLGRQKSFKNDHRCT